MTKIINKRDVADAEQQQAAWPDGDITDRWTTDELRRFNEYNAANPPAEPPPTLDYNRLSAAQLRTLAACTDPAKSKQLESLYIAGQQRAGG